MPGVEAVGCPTATRRYGVELAGVEGFSGVPGLGGLVSRNWEGTLSAIATRLSKWSWILSQVSYRGRTPINKKLVASSLWHKLAVLNPPPSLLENLQRSLVDFFSPVISYINMHYSDYYGNHHHLILVVKTKNETYIKQWSLHVQQKSSQLCIALVFTTPAARSTAEITPIFALVLFRAWSNSFILHCFSLSVFLFLLFTLKNRSTKMYLKWYKPHEVYLFERQFCTHWCRYIFVPYQIVPG